MEIAKVLAVAGGETERLTAHVAHGARRLLLGAVARRLRVLRLVTFGGRWRTRHLGRAVAAVLLEQVAQIAGSSNVQFAAYTTNGRPFKLIRFVVLLRRRLLDCFSCPAKNTT